MALQKVNTKLSTRDVGLDGLRVIGLLAIILAHVGPPGWLFQLRNFDVPLMVLVSGAVFNLSSGASKSYFSYFKNRVGRLYIPTFIFLSIFFTLVYFISKSIGQNFPYSASTLLNSFALTDGTGYVWIIRVFILVAIALPFLIKVYDKLGDKRFYAPILLGSFLVYQLLLHLYSTTHLVQNLPVINYLIKYVVLYIIPYGIIAGLGFYLTKLSSKSILILGVSFSLLFIFLATFYAAPSFIPTQNFKYPPQAYYFSYALAVSLFLYLGSKTQVFKKIFENKILMFISSSSLWIFLWQILFLFIWSTFRKYLNPSFQNFIVEYVFVVIFSVLITFLQKIIFRKVINRIDKHKPLSNFVKTAFLK